MPLPAPLPSRSLTQSSSAKFAVHRHQHFATQEATTTSTSEEGPAEEAAAENGCARLHASSAIAVNAATHPHTRLIACNVMCLCSAEAAPLTPLERARAALQAEEMDKAEMVCAWLGRCLSVLISLGAVSCVGKCANAARYDQSASPPACFGPSQAYYASLCCRSPFLANWMRSCRACRRRRQLQTRGLA